MSRLSEPDCGFIGNIKESEVKCAHTLWVLGVLDSCFFFFQYFCQILDVMVWSSWKPEYKYIYLEQEKISYALKENTMRHCHHVMATVGSRLLARHKNNFFFASTDLWHFVITALLASSSVFPAFAQSISRLCKFVSRSPFPILAVFMPASSPHNASPLESIKDR